MSDPYYRSQGWAAIFRSISEMRQSYCAGHMLVLAVVGCLALIWGSPPARADDANACKVLALRFLPRGATLKQLNLSLADPKILRQVDRSNGDKDHLGHNWLWYYLALTIDIAGSDATIPLLCARNAFGKYAFVDLMTGATVVLQ